MHYYPVRLYKVNLKVQIVCFFVCFFFKGEGEANMWRLNWQLSMIKLTLSKKVLKQLLLHAATGSSIMEANLVNSNYSALLQPDQ